MKTTNLLWTRLSPAIGSAKRGWGPYKHYREGLHFVGTEPCVLKYHHIPDKKPQQPYGLQGNNHLLPFYGKVAAKLPTKTLLQKDKMYTWCACGYSHAQPLCDGSHNSYHYPDNNCRPVRYIPDRDMEVWLCNCKQTKNRPFCDGSHNHLKKEETVAELMDL